jgi:hypothetical protein
VPITAAEAAAVTMVVLRAVALATAAGPTAVTAAALTTIPVHPIIIRVPHPAGHTARLAVAPAIATARVTARASHHRRVRASALLLRMARVDTITVPRRHRLIVVRLHLRISAAADLRIRRPDPLRAAEQTPVLMRILARPRLQRMQPARITPRHFPLPRQTAVRPARLRRLHAAHQPFPPTALSRTSKILISAVRLRPDQLLWAVAPRHPISATRPSAARTLVPPVR